MGIINPQHKGKIMAIEKDWISEAGLRCVCLIVRGTHRCGYVQVSNDSPLFGMNYDQVPVECHGGLTYSDVANDGSDYPVKSDGWWFGFDCWHADDGLIGGGTPERPERSLDYVVKQCESVAKQLVEIESC